MTLQRGGHVAIGPLLQGLTAVKEKLRHLGAHQYQIKPHMLTLIRVRHGSNNPHGHQIETYDALPSFCGTNGQCLVRWNRAQSP